MGRGLDTCGRLEARQIGCRLLVCGARQRCYVLILGRETEGHPRSNRMELDNLKKKLKNLKRKKLKFEFIQRKN